MDLISALQQEELGQVRVGHHRVHFQTDGHDRLASGDAGQPFGSQRLIAAIAQQGRGNRCRLEQRLDQSNAAGFLERQHHLQLGERQAAVLFGNEHAEHTHLRELAPQLGRAAGFGFPRGTDRIGRHLACEERTDALLKALLVFGEEKIHDQALGRPSSRSAITLRWISFVPA